MSDNLNNRLPRIIVPGYYSRKCGSCSVLSTDRGTQREILRKRPRNIGVRAGGARGLQPPQILGNSDFLGSKRKFGQSQLLKTFHVFYEYFGEINIFYFNLKSV